MCLIVSKSLTAKFKARKHPIKVVKWAEKSASGVIFSPFGSGYVWGLGEHKPIGRISRARKDIGRGALHFYVDTIGARRLMKRKYRAWYAVIYATILPKDILGVGNPRRPEVAVSRCMVSKISYLKIIKSPWR